MSSAPGFSTQPPAWSFFSRSRALERAHAVVVRVPRLGHLLQKGVEDVRVGHLCRPGRGHLLSHHWLLLGAIGAGRRGAEHAAGRRGRGTKQATARGGAWGEQPAGPRLGRCGWYREAGLVVRAREVSPAIGRHRSSTKQPTARWGRSRAAKEAGSTKRVGGG